MMVAEQVVVVCLQAQHVAGLPAAAEGRQILLLQEQQQQIEKVVAAAARCRAGVAAFHDQVLLLHCAPASSIASLVAVAVTVDYTTTSDLTVRVDLAEQLHRPSPSVLSFVLGDGGAVLSLTLHHRRLPHRRRSACLPDLLLNCVRVRMPTDNQQDDDDGQSSSGFITIEKGTISRRHQPSDNLLTTDEDEPSKPSTAEELRVEDEFLAIYCDGDLDTLIKDAEAELAAVDDLYL